MPRPKLLYKPGFIVIRCPNCGQPSYMNEHVMEGPPELNVNRCLNCFTEVKMLRLDPLVLGVVPGSGPAGG